MTERDDGTGVDWTKCILCQETTSEPLQCPGNSRRSDIECGTGYNTLASTILQFSEIRSLPIPIIVEMLDEGGGITEPLMQRKAKLQKSCRDKFSNMKLKKAEKRKRQEEPGSPRFKFTRACFGATTFKPEKSCFFSGSSSETFHEASTFNIDTRVRDCAHRLQDKVLIAKLSAVGDMISQEAVYHAKCLVELYNKAESSKQSTINGNEKRI